MNVTLLSGSSRKNNNTLRLAKAIALACQKYPQTEKLQLVDFQLYDIPFFNQKTLKPDNLSPFQSELVSAIDDADLVFLLSPEYNWFPSAEVINMVHQLGQREFKHLFDNKVFSFAGVSTGRGGRVPAIQMGYMMDKLFNFFDVSGISCPRKFESQFTTKVLDENGHSLGNGEYDKGLAAYVDYSIETAARWNS